MRGLSFFGFGSGGSEGSRADRSGADLGKGEVGGVSLKVRTDKDVYRPGDCVYVIIEVSNPSVVVVANGAATTSDSDRGGKNGGAVLVERIGFELKGVERLDTQWFATQKPLPGSKQRRGELVFLDCSSPSLISNQIISSGSTKTYIVKTELPEVLPPTYKGTTIRYLYYVKSSLCGRWLVLENSHALQDSDKIQFQQEARSSLQIWVTQKTDELLNEGTFPSSTIQMDIFWKEKDADSEWIRANDTTEGVEEGYESSRDEVSSVSSYNPTKGNIESAFGSSLSLQSYAMKGINKDVSYIRGERSSTSSHMLPRQLSAAEELYDANGDVIPPQKMSPSVSSSNQSKKHVIPHPSDDDAGLPSAPGSVETVTSEGFVRGRSYNIRLDDQVLLRFSPKNSDSNYYFSDTIGGTLTFFHEEGARRCLEVSITLETSETVGQRFVHPSRRNTPAITKVQSDHHEVVADLLQSSFIFSIPPDGPMSFSTPHVTVQWALRFEFFTTPKNVDWSRYDHPLLIEGRDKGEWVLPITVHAPPPRAQGTQTRNEKPLSLGPIWS
ncbi:hypothetical protein Sjap_019461 [Stephania japonica]|uniref:Reduced growth phenotype protein 1 n=1 Tax=Stephania japonica TaxID=461633 RepID=A0AAP0HY62_9MAGN